MGSIFVLSNSGKERLFLKDTYYVKPRLWYKKFKYLIKYRGVVMKFEINNSRKNDNSHTWYLNYQNK